MFSKIYNFLKFWLSANPTLQVNTFLIPEKTYMAELMSGGCIKVKVTDNANIIKYKNICMCWDAIQMMARQSQNQMIGDIIVQYANEGKKK